MLNSAPKVIWPRAYPLYALLGFAVALTAGGACGFRQLSELQPLQKYYFPIYVMTHVLPFPGNQHLLKVATTHGQTLAIDPWIGVRGHGKTTSFFVTPEGQKAGVRGPFLALFRKVDPEVVKQFLAANIYHDSFLGLFSLTYWVTGLLSVLGIGFGSWLDSRRETRVRQGVQLRGLHKLSPREAAQRIKGDGLAIFLKPSSK